MRAQLDIKATSTPGSPPLHLHDSCRCSRAQLHRWKNAASLARAVSLLLFCPLSERRIPRDTGIREHDVEFALLLFDLREEAIQIAKVRHVSLYGGNIFPDLFYSCSQL